MVTVFVSHATTDRVIVDLLDELFKKTYGPGNIKLKYSSSKMSSDGIPFGDDWYQWILQEVKNCEIALIVLTSNSINKPWILWEAGAVKGVALASEKEKRVLALTFGLVSDQVPAALSQTQNVKGDDASEITKMLKEIYQRSFRIDISKGEDVVDYYTNIRENVSKYINEVNRILLDLPIMITSSMINEWCRRIIELTDRNRESEVGVLERWIWLSFGIIEEKDKYPLDMKLHLLLGDAYLSSKKYDEAIFHYNLAKRMAPRDIFILRKLGQVFLECNKFDRAQETLACIESFDSGAFIDNSECAGLRGRLFKELYKESQSEEDLHEALNAYNNAFKQNLDSYYLADNVGQLSLQADDEKTANYAFSTASNIIRGLPKQSVWSLATGITSELYLGNKDVANGYLIQLKEKRPSTQVIQSIQEGVENILRYLITKGQYLEHDFDDWRNSFQF